MENTTLYQERFNRIRKTINLEPVDRVPVVYMGVAFAPRYMGMTIADYCADAEAAAQVNLSAMDRMGKLDGCNLAAAGRITPLLTSIWMSRLGVPGKDLPTDSLWQRPITSLTDLEMEMASNRDSTLTNFPDQVTCFYNVPFLYINLGEMCI